MKKFVIKIFLFIALISVIMFVVVAFDRYVIGGQYKLSYQASLVDKVECQTAHCRRCKPHFDFGVIASPIVPYRNLTQTADGITADCRSLV